MDRDFFHVTIGFINMTTYIVECAQGVRHHNRVGARTRAYF